MIGIIRLVGNTTTPDLVDSSVDPKDPAKGSRVFESEALVTLNLIGKP